MDKLTVFSAIWNPPSELIKDHIENWRKYSDETRKRTHFIMVDDHSPNFPYKFDIDFPMNFTHAWVRTPGIGFNVAGCRNLGAMLAQTKWVIVTDCDHFILSETAKKLLDWDPPPHKMYRFNGRTQQELDGSIINRRVHLGTNLLEREEYLKAGGYDEDFSGGYELEWVPFWKQLELNGVPPVIVDGFPTFVKLSYAADFDRTLERNKQILAEKQKRPYIPGPMIRFKWDIVQELRY